MKTNQSSGIVRINRPGAPSILEYTTEIIGEPEENQVLLKQEAIALNFVDVLFRNGTIPLSDFPATIGVEAAGVIEAVGKHVNNLVAGDRVAYYFSLGAYAQRRLLSADSLIKLPDYVSFDQAASLMAKGLTARMLIKQAYPVKAGDIILVHAAAGGVGSLISRWAKALGATVIGTVGNVSKKTFALGHGIDHVIALDTEDMSSIVRAITGNKGVQAVFDGVGQATFAQSADLIISGGSAVLFGSSSGAPQIDSAHLDAKGIKLVRPSLGNYLPDQTSVQLAADELFEAFRNGIFGELSPTVYPLADVAKAHQEMESGRTTGSIIFHS